MQSRLFGAAFRLALAVFVLVGLRTDVKAQAPIVNSFSPALGPPGTAVVVKGSGFTGATGAGIGDNTAIFTVDSDSQLHFTVPANATTNHIKVVTPGGKGWSAGCFVVGSNYPAPAITTFTPNSGGAGTSVLITGTGLASTTEVAFNGTDAAFTTISDLYVRAVVPAGATNGPITITTLGGQATSANSYTTGVGGGGGNPPANNTAPPAHVNPPSTAVTAHPRLWIRQQDLPRLRSWAANPKNQVFADLQTVALYYRTRMDQGIVPGQDNGEGDNDNVPNPSEEYAETFALMSLVDPNISLRADWAQRAHDLIMVIMNQAVLGPQADTPFRTPHFATYDRSRWYGEAFPLVVDWCYNTFSAAEKKTIRKVFIRWCNELQDPDLSYCPQPAGAYNNTGALITRANVRWAGNNYRSCHARNLGMMALALDPADDVQDPTITGDRNYYLGDYIGALFGEWLLIRNYAENPAVAAVNGVGHDLVGGMGIEGPLYSESTYAAYTQLQLALHTSGFDTSAAVAIYGPQAAFCQNSFWQRDVLTGFCHSMSPALHQLQPWWAPQYLPASFGDCLRFDNEDMISSFAPLAAMDLADGNAASPRLNAIRWMETVLPAGGWPALDSRLTSSPWNYGSLLPIMYFLIFDPALTDSSKTPVVSDPRPSMGLDYLAPGLNRILSRTDWTANATWFAFISAFSNTDHQWEDSNSFSFYRKGEWLTKEWTGYGMNIRCTDYTNNLSIENPPLSPNALSYNLDQAVHGSQYSYNSDGDPVVKTSLKPGYIFAEGDTTKRYNMTAFQATDVAHASRSILWIKPDFIVVYDRAISKSPNQFKRVTFNSVTQPMTHGNCAGTVTPNGQRMFITTVLPASATVSWDQPTTTWNWNEEADYEINQYRIIVEDTSRPLSVRYLNVIQGADMGTKKTACAAIIPTAGAYEGASFSNVAVLFAQSLSQPFTGLAYTVPAATTTHFVTGLTPGAGYTVTRQAQGGVVNVTVTPGGSMLADRAGLLTF
jgi:hypothetical protein